MQQQAARFSALILRLTLGVCFVLHGAPKVVDLFGRHGAGSWPAEVEAMGLVPALPVAVAIAFGQLLAALAMVLGAWTKTASVVVVVIMAGAIWKVHGPHGYYLANGGFEYDVALIAIAVSLFLTGPGAYAVRFRSGD